MRGGSSGWSQQPPRLRLEVVAGWWLERYERRVATGERRVRTLEMHRYLIRRHVLPLLGSRLIRQVTVVEVVDWLDCLRGPGVLGEDAGQRVGDAE